MTRRRWIILLAALGFGLFLGWRFLRPMNIFIVAPDFERPVSTDVIPAPLKTLRAAECRACHAEFYEEWSTTIHSQAWTDPYFQVDWVFDGSQQICKNCHIPLDRQQEHRVLGFRDKEKWQPILEPNPEFDAALQHEGVTCTVCHLREGRIVGVYGIDDAPHPVSKLNNPNEICVRCHVVSGERWDTFFRFPPCGTVAEIQAGRGGRVARSGETVAPDPASLNCVECHMPLVQRPLVEGGPVRAARRHLWRGGHDPDRVRSALTIKPVLVDLPDKNKRRFTLTLTNTGAAHYVPTGTPDRHLTVELRLLDAAGAVIEERKHVLKRTILWRPFIVDLWDTRLPYNIPREFVLEFPRQAKAAALEAVVRYHLLDEERRKRIGYEPEKPISYEVYRQRLDLLD